MDFLEEREIATTLGIIGAGERIRTLDPRITSAPLYQLSYAGLLMEGP